MGFMETPLIVPVGSAPARTSNSLKEIAVAVAIVLVVIVAGWFTTQHFVIEPEQQKAAFVEVAGSSADQLSAKSVDELVTLDTRIYEFAKSTPGMRFAADDQAMRVEHAIDDKRGGK